MQYIFLSKFSIKGFNNFPVSNSIPIKKFRKKMCQHLSKIDSAIHWARLDIGLAFLKINTEAILKWAHKLGD